METAIRWFAKNSVAANLLMFTIVALGGYAVFGKLVYEVFPSTESNVVSISVVHRGATPHEVEKAVVTRIEETIQDLQGIDQILSTAAEGLASIRVELKNGYEPRELLDDIKNRVDAINTFPEEIERPIYKVVERKREVISVLISTGTDEKSLREKAVTIRDEILMIPGISQVELTGVRSFEMSIEISELELQKYGLSFDDVSTAIKRSSLDIPGGSIRTSSGEVLLRTVNQAYTKEDFNKIPLISSQDGTQIYLGDIATIKDSFEEAKMRTRYNGKETAVLNVYRVGDQNAISISEDIQKYINENTDETVQLSFWNDRARIINSRLGTLGTSAWQGIILVFIILALFLRFTVAMWVCIGIPISFLGTLVCMPYLGVTINIMSLFAFILVLGIVVDDAIVTGENIYTHMKKSKRGEDAAINGTLEVSAPVTFGVLTTVAAFLPLTMLEGKRGPIFAQIALVVIPVLLFSLVESKLILPSHLKHMKPSKGNTKNPFVRVQQFFSHGLESFIAKIYQPILRLSLKWRYLTIATFTGLSLLLYSLPIGGVIGWTPFPRIEHEVITVSLEMPLGTDFDVTHSYVQRIQDAAEKIRDKYVDSNENSMVSGILAYSGNNGNSTKGQSHLGRVYMQMEAPEKRTMEISVRKISKEWRRMIGTLPGEAKLSVKAEIGRSSDPVDVELSGSDFKTLAEVSEKVKDYLNSYPGVFDVTDSFEGGKEEIKLKLKPDAELLGVSSADLGRQVRQAFFGDQAQRIQRDRDDIRVMVRYPEEERRSINTIESMRIRLNDGTEIPFNTVADIETGRGFAKIQRVDRRRTVNVKADINKLTVNASILNADIAKALKTILLDYPSVSTSLEGEAKDTRETSSSLMWGLMFSFFVIYGLLAIPFKSYLQPFIVMSVIPYGLAGSILGHLVLGLPLSMMSAFGMLALVGVVVNDSLVLVDYVNKRREEGIGVLESAFNAGGARFRPIILTSLTTFAGLMPLILEKSTQAQFLIPMAVSLGFGILYATLVTLFLVPANYLVLEDLKNLYSKQE